jgi:hypothetical protein
VNDELTIGRRVEIASGSYSELEGVITFREKDAAFVRLDGERFDLRFPEHMLRPLGVVQQAVGARLL